MKKVLLILGVVVVATACNKSNKKIQEKISGADSVAINYFKGDGTMDSVVDVKIISDKKMMEDLSTLIGEVSAKPGIKCGYDGSLHFFKKNVVVQDIDFRMNDSTCMYFTFKRDGVPEATELSVDARRMLRMIQKYE